MDLKKSGWLKELHLDLVESHHICSNFEQPGAGDALAAQCGKINFLPAVIPMRLLVFHHLILYLH